MEWWCPLHIAAIWISRATGIGYRDFPPIDQHFRGARDLQHQTDALVIQIEQLERELRRRGDLPSDE